MKHFHINIAALLLLAVNGQVKVGENHPHLATSPLYPKKLTCSEARSLYHSAKHCCDGGVDDNATDLLVMRCIDGSDCHSGLCGGDCYCKALGYSGTSLCYNHPDSPDYYNQNLTAAGGAPSAPPPGAPATPPPTTNAPTLQLSGDVPPLPPEAYSYVPEAP